MKSQSEDSLSCSDSEGGMDTTAHSGQHGRMDGESPTSRETYNGRQLRARRSAARKLDYGLTAGDFDDDGAPWLLKPAHQRYWSMHLCRISDFYISCRL